MNKPLDEIVFQSGKITVSVVLKTILIVLLGGLLCVILWLMLLPLFKACGLEGEAAVKCVVLFLGVLFLALGGPFLFFWFGKNYALKKALHRLYDEYKNPVLMVCAEKACKHKTKIIQAQKFKTGKFFKDLPFVVRLALKRIDLSFLVQILKEKPDISPTDLELKIEQHIDQMGIIKKPSLLFFWVTSGAMILIFFGLKSWV